MAMFRQWAIHVREKFWMPGDERARSLISAATKPILGLCPGLCLSFLSGSPNGCAPDRELSQP